MQMQPVRPFHGSMAMNSWAPRFMWRWPNVKTIGKKAVDLDVAAAVVVAVAEVASIEAILVVAMEAEAMIDVVVEAAAVAAIVDEKVIGRAQAVVIPILLGGMNAIDARSRKVSVQ